MNDETGTAAELARAARALFARHGYHGASVRAITRAAGANLGAITYHFGSKRALYEAAIASVLGPSTEHLARAAEGAGSALDRIERLVRALFDYLGRHPELPRILTHHLAAALPIAEAARQTMQRNLALLVGLITDGQRGGVIRPGDPRLLAVSILSQPVFLSLMRDMLQQGVGIDQDNPRAREDLVSSVVRFIRAGLAVESHG